MSESTRDKKNGKHPDRKDHDFPFFMISLILHVVVIGAVIWIGPVRRIVWEHEKPEKPEIITRGDELEEIVDDIRDRTVERLKMRVELLDMGQERMANNFRILNEHHQPYVEQQRATAHIRFSEYANEALRRQKLLMDKFLEAQEQGESKYEAAIEASFSNASQIFTAQEEIRRGIELLGIEDAELMEKQHAAEETQITSENAQRWFAQDVQKLESTREKLAKVKEEIPEVRQEAQALEKVVNDKQKKSDNLQEEIKNLQQDLQENRTQERKTKDQEKRKQLNEKRKELANRIQEKEKERGKVNPRDDSRGLKRLQDRLKNLEKSRANLEQQIPEIKASINTHLTLAVNTQRGVYHRQKQIVETVNAMLEEREDQPGQTEEGEDI